MESEQNQLALERSWCKTSNALGYMQFEKDLQTTAKYVWIYFEPVKMPKGLHIFAVEMAINVLKP